MFKKIYLAAHYARNAEMRDIRDELETYGHKVTSGWIDQHGGKLTEALGERELNGNPDLGTPYALKDIAGIMSSDVLVSFTGNGRGGRHVEFGVAWALGKSLVIVGNREHVFHCLPGIEWYPNWSEMRLVWCP